MANLYITEFQRLPKDAQGNVVPVARMAPVVEQKIAFTTAAASAAFGTKTKFVRLIADAKAHIEFGGGPTATAANTYIPADVAEYFAVLTGQKVSAYDGSS